MSKVASTIHNEKGDTLASVLDTATGVQTPVVTADASGSGAGSAATDAVTTAVTVANTSTVVLAANPLRRGGSFKNTHATATIYLTFGSTVPTTSLYTIDVLPGEYYEIPSMYWGLACNGIVASGTAVLNKTDAS